MIRKKRKGGTIVDNKMSQSHTKYATISRRFIGAGITKMSVINKEMGNGAENSE